MIRCKILDKSGMVAKLYDCIGPAGINIGQIQQINLLNAYMINIGVTHF